jgi:hypothetical protein
MSNSNQSSSIKWKRVFALIALAPLVAVGLAVLAVGSLILLVVERLGGLSRPRPAKRPAYDPAFEQLKLQQQIS